MNYIAAAVSDRGQRREINQDALMVKTRQTAMGNMCVAVICDGMGGLSCGEVASAHAIRRLSEWFMCYGGSIHRFDKVVYEIEREIYGISEEISKFGYKNGLTAGTTATVLVLSGNSYAVIHVGDTRVYRLKGGYAGNIRQITTDHSVNDYMLTQSVGTGSRIKPEIIRGRVKRGDVFLMCTDGFRHRNLPGDIRKGMAPGLIKSETDILARLKVYVDRARSLGETDDISAAVIKVI